MAFPHLILILPLIKLATKFAVGSTHWPFFGFAIPWGLMVIIHFYLGSICVSVRAIANILHLKL